MPDKQRKAAIRLLKAYWRKSFYQVESLPDYITAVTKQLNKIGFVNVPQTPQAFVAFCQELGLFEKVNKSNKKGN